MRIEDHDWLPRRGDVGHTRGGKFVDQLSGAFRSELGRCAGMAARDTLRNELVSPPGRSAPCAGFGDIRGDRGEQRRCVETSDEIGYGVDLPGVAPEFLKDESNGLKVWAEVADACAEVAPNRLRDYVRLSTP